jgi:hypothetical protein
MLFREFLRSEDLGGRSILNKKRSPYRVAGRYGGGGHDVTLPEKTLLMLEESAPA